MNLYPKKTVNKLFLFVIINHILKEWGKSHLVLV
jgi:hypothetical protein